MLDQSFSARNFHRIFDIENRKGKNLEFIYFPDIKLITDELKDNRTSFKALKKIRPTLSVADYEQKKNDLNVRKDELKSQKKDALALELEETSKKLANIKYKVSISILPAKVRGKSVYKIGDSAAEYFAIKQVQGNIRRLYKVKQANRELILPQLREVIGDKMSKIVVRTDIASFYESIDRERLLTKLSRDGLLGYASLKVISSVLNDYGVLSNSSKGIPRGIGLSAYLAEIYMKSLDRYVRNIDGVIYYARYVDDIVIVYCEIPNVRPGSKLKASLKRLKDTEGLTLNKSKTQIVRMSNMNDSDITYLGYKFEYKSGSVHMYMSPDKFDRYKHRVNKAFSEHKKSSNTKTLMARRLLIARIKLLTGNTRLLNSKKNAFIGIYFSNSLLTKDNQLAALDTLLSGRINQLASHSLKRKLANFSFIEGYRKKEFVKFSASRLKQVIANWKVSHD